MIILTTNNFKVEGFNRIPFTDFTKVGLQETIDEKEEWYLTQLLGVELKDLFIADLVSGVPQTAIYLDLFNPFIKEIWDCNVQSLGITKYLEGCIYWEYMQRANYKVTEAGNVSKFPENSLQLEFENNQIIAEKRFNQAKFTADAIQLYICDNMTVYPTYDGDNLKIKSSLYL